MTKTSQTSLVRPKATLQYLNAIDLLPPDLLAEARQKLTNRQVFIQKIGTETLNQHETRLGAELTRKIRQALMLMSTGMLVYFGRSNGKPGRPSNACFARALRLLAEGWPARVVSDTLGVSYATVRGWVRKLKKLSAAAELPPPAPQSEWYEAIVGNPPRIQPEQMVEAITVTLTGFGLTGPVSQVSGLAQLTAFWQAASVKTGSGSWDATATRRRVGLIVLARWRLRQMRLEPPDALEHNVFLR